MKTKIKSKDSYQKLRTCRPYFLIWLRFEEVMAKIQTDKFFCGHGVLEKEWSIYSFLKMPPLIITFGSAIAKSRQVESDTPFKKDKVRSIYKSHCSLCNEICKFSYQSVLFLFLNIQISSPKANIFVTILIICVSVTCGSDMSHEQSWHYVAMWWVYTNKNGVLWSQARMRIEMRLRCYLVIGNL